MKEKIGIEKLGELLRKYSYGNHDYHWTLYVNGKFEGSVPGTDHDLSNEEMGMVIKSKEYGFIQRLVENDKIDVPKMKEKMGIPSFVWYVNGEPNCIKEEDDAEQVIMLLSIQEQPIRFLCEILK